MRGVFQGAAIDDRSGEEVYALTGHFPAFLLAASRIGWLQDSRPALYERLATVLPLGSWLACALTGARVSEPSIDAEAGLLDIPLRSVLPAWKKSLVWKALGCHRSALRGLSQVDSADR